MHSRIYPRHAEDVRTLYIHAMVPLKKTSLELSPFRQRGFHLYTACLVEILFKPHYTPVRAEQRNTSEAVKPSAY